MAVLYLLLTGAGAAFAIFREALADPKSSATENLIVGLVIMAICLPFAGLYAAGLVLPRKPWSWIYHIVLISIGLTSCACLPFAVPLLVFWIRPEVQDWFGRRTAVVGGASPFAHPGAPPPP
jgi:hypothetical protein